jgi:MFS transporter, FSR family, fosmidomycin resistance protein
MTAKKENGAGRSEECAAATDVASAGEARTVRQRNLVLLIVNMSHLVNHVQSSMVSILYPVMMNELGFGFYQMGILQTLYQLSAQGCQVLYGMLVRFFPRSVLLGTANILLGIFGLATGASHSYTQVAVSRTLAGVGSSAQHPVGSAILISYFPKARGRVLTGNNSVGQLGSMLAPAVVGLLFLLSKNNWKLVFYVVSIPSILMGVLYFSFRDVVTVSGGSPKEKARSTMMDYWSCLKNRNVMLVTMIQMIGAAGRGTGINEAFLAAFLMKALNVNITMAAVLMMVYQGGGLVGPIFLGWLSDRFNRKLVMQFTLLFSTVATLWLLAHHGFTIALILNLILYGTVVNARGSLTQALVSSAVPLSQMDTAFSLYFFIGFISGPIWTFIMGVLIQAYGFNRAFLVVSVSYLTGMVMMAFTTASSEAAEEATPARR